MGFATNLKQARGRGQRLRDRESEEGRRRKKSSSPFMIRLSDNDDRFSSFSLQLVGSFRVEVVLDDGIETVARKEKKTEEMSTRLALD